MIQDGSNALKCLWKRITIILILLTLYLPISVRANETTLITTVPTHCSLQVIITGRGTVSVNGKATQKSASFSVKRHEDIAIEIQSGLGYQIASVSLNGSDMTEELHSGKLMIDAQSSDSILSIIFVKKDVIWPDANPPTGDSIISSVICCGVSMIGLLTLHKRKRT